MTRRPLAAYAGGGYWWFRIFGVGLHGRDVTRTRPLFSERHRLGARWFRVGRWAVRVLTP